MNAKQQTTAICLLVVGLLISSCSTFAQPAPAATSVPPTLVPTPTNWNGIPIMPGYLTAQEDMGDYQFTIKASAEDIKTYYGQEMARLGWKFSPELMPSGSTDPMYTKGSAYVAFKIFSQGDVNTVYIHLVK